MGLWLRVHFSSSPYAESLVLLVFVGIVLSRLIGVVSTKQGGVLRGSKLVLHADRILLDPGADVDAALACWLESGDDPNAEEEEGDAEGNESDLVWGESAKLVVEHKAI
jgi:hypothetical protein